MNIALWIIGLLVLVLVGGGRWLAYYTRNWGDGAVGIGVVLLGAYGIAAVLAVAWVVLLIVKLARG